VTDRWTDGETFLITIAAVNNNNQKKWQLRCGRHIGRAIH